MHVCILTSCFQEGKNVSFFFFFPTLSLIAMAGTSVLLPLKWSWVLTYLLARSWFNFYKNFWTSWPTTVLLPILDQ